MWQSLPYQDVWIKKSFLTGPKNFKWGKDEMIKFLQNKEIIQSFIWNRYLSKIDKQDPYEISKFEKEIKKLSYTIQDETLKKYVLEDFLEKIKKLISKSDVIHV